MKTDITMFFLYLGKIKDAISCTALMTAIQYTSAANNLTSNNPQSRCAENVYGLIVESWQVCDSNGGHVKNIKFY